VPVSFVGGNHDAWAGSFLRDEVGVTLLEGPVEMELGGRRALVAHGDGVGRGDYRYRALRKVIRPPRLRSPPSAACTPDTGRRIAGLASTTEHKADSGDQAAKGRAAFIRGWAEEQLARMPHVELVVAGHAHVPEVAEVAPGAILRELGGLDPELHVPGAAGGGRGAGGAALGVRAPTPAPHLRRPSPKTAWGRGRSRPSALSAHAEERAVRRGDSSRPAWAFLDLCPARRTDLVGAAQRGCPCRTSRPMPAF
jgi:hypothetical protein